MLKTYYKFMVVRHPFDRIVSAYIDKLLPRHDGYRKQMGTKILKMLHPHLLKIPLPEVYFKFDDVVRYIANGGYDMHFQGPYSFKCEPCMIKYDYLMKVETFLEDSTYLVMNHMRGRGVGTKRNSNRPMDDSLVYDRTLEEFVNVTELLLAKIMSKYQDDFNKFGYNYHYEDNMLHATCSGENGCC